jgi:hypothetical protein
MPDIRQQWQQLRAIPAQIRPTWILVNISHAPILRLNCGECNNYLPRNLRRIIPLIPRAAKIIAVVTLRAGQVRPIANDEIAHARQVALIT